MWVLSVNGLHKCSTQLHSTLSPPTPINGILSFSLYSHPPYSIFLVLPNHKRSRCLTASLLPESCSKSLGHRSRFTFRYAAILHRPLAPKQQPPRQRASAKRRHKLQSPRRSQQRVVATCCPSFMLRLDPEEPPSTHFWSAWLRGCSVSLHRAKAWLLHLQARHARCRVHP